MSERRDTFTTGKIELPPADPLLRAMLRALLENHVPIMLALSRQPGTPISLGEDLRARATRTQALLDKALTQKPG